MAVTYDQIRIAPYKIESLEYINIKKRINEHSYLTLRAILKEEDKDNAINRTSVDSQIQVFTDDEDAKTLFEGMVTDVKVTSIGGLYYLDIKGASNSMQLDVKRKCRSFQDKEMTYEQLVQKVAGECNAEVIDTASKNSATEKFLLQYDETDWEFLKRLASHFNQGLVPVAKYSKAKFFFGLPDGKTRGDLDEYEYSITKDIKNYKRSLENSDPSLIEADRIYYEIVTDRFFEIGDHVTYDKKKLCIKEADIEIRRAMIKNTYKLATKEGCRQDKIYNERIIGLSIQGTVLETSKDELKLHLCIDETQDKGKAHYFRYATIYTAGGNGGFYFMPEINDTVFSYFPNEKEWEGFALQSIRKKDDSGDKTSDPDVKRLRTQNGKEIKIAPDEILLSCADDQIYIKLNENTGIEIFSTKPIKVHSSQDLTIDAENEIYLTAKKEINMTCKTSFLKLDGNVTIQGKEVKNN